MLGSANQLQIYKDTTVYHPNYLLKFTTIETVQLHPTSSPDIPVVETNPLLLNLEVVIVAILLLTLPILIYLAYRYGKKMGRKEHKPVIHNQEAQGMIMRRFSQESTSDYSLPPAASNSQTSSALSSPIIKKLSLPQVPLKKEDSSSPETGNPNKRELPAQNESEQIEKLSLSDQFSFKTSPKFEIVGLQKKTESDIIDDFNLVYAYSCGSEDEDHKEMEDGMLDEKIKLHSQDDQVVKKKVRYGVSIQNKGTHLEKTEIKELCTIYDPQSEVPEKKAAIIKENYQNTPIHNKLFFSSKRLSQDKTQERLAICGPESYPLESPLSTTLAERKTSKTTETSSKGDKLQTTIETSKIETIVEKYGVPDETGKFAKIFKDVEWIGEGSFGEVSKVAHRLDGKIYAVKKVKLKLGRFEELKKESKVFREVFAMTDLHHPNIVRYSTCWVEIEWEKETDTKEKFEKSWLGDPLTLGDISENEISEEEVSKQRSERSKTSDLGFEWDVSVSEKEKTKNKEQKKKDKIRESLKKKALDKMAPTRKRKNSNLLIKTLSRSFIEEEVDELSKNSSLSKVESLSEVPGCKLCLYIQMEYCAGQSLKYYLENPKRQIVRNKVLEMFKKLLEGVNAIHSRGILHRDLKPANIFLDGNENVKIGDFGLASLGKFDEQVEGATPKDLAGKRNRKLHSLKVGTPMYTSPEQESGGHYDQKTDVYSLGLIFYEMLINFATNHERYEHFGLIRKEHALPEMFLKSFPAESEIILRMTSTSPEDRPTAEKVMIEVDKLLTELKHKIEQKS